VRTPGKYQWCAAAQIVALVGLHTVRADELADAAVHFDYYELAQNEDGTPGWPEFYFRAKRTTTAHAQYCDVNDAFEKELHLSR
jgi:hypothetical protein